MKNVVKFISVVLVIVMGALMLTACGGDNGTAEVSQPTMSQSEFRNYVYGIIRDAYGDSIQYDVYWDGDSFVISMWDNLLTDGAAQAASGNAQCKAAWKDAANSLIGLNNTIYQAAQQEGFADITVFTNILNSYNLDNGILIIANGSIVYDCVS